MEIKLNGGKSASLSSICNEKDFSDHLQRFPERWEAAFRFLADNDINSLADGEYELLPGREAYASVSTYAPKNPEDCLFESHREYIDLQLIAAGSEEMGVTREELPVVTPFTPGNDYALYANRAEHASYENTAPSRFYIFFPTDLHRPCIKNADSTAEVRKIVIKLRF